MLLAKALDVAVEDARAGAVWLASLHDHGADASLPEQAAVPENSSEWGDPSARPAT
ncbi:hypothetical protein [Streptomyces tendae]|uniref:hypothetical protein n=1 Tax=Streptomyces tendae TaxID=1932 RepID=UPI00249154C8|nr:hypothetical protein [Streptomyces tendae]